MAEPPAPTQVAAYVRSGGPKMLNDLVQYKKQQIAGSTSAINLSEENIRTNGLFNSLLNGTAPTKIANDTAKPPTPVAEGRYQAALREAELAEKLAKEKRAASDAIKKIMDLFPDGQVPDGVWN